MGTMKDRFEKSGVSPTAIAVTATFSQIAFAASLGVEFPMLSDWDGRVANAYGVQYREWKGHSGLAKRSVFLVDRSGLVRFRWVTDDALVTPNLEEVMSSVDSIEPPGPAASRDPS